MFTVVTLDIISTLLVLLPPFIFGGNFSYFQFGYNDNFVVLGIKINTYNRYVALIITMIINNIVMIISIKCKELNEIDEYIEKDNLTPVGKITFWTISVIIKINVLALMFVVSSQIDMFILTALIFMANTCYYTHKKYKKHKFD